MLMGEHAKGSALPTPTAGPNNDKKLLKETVWHAYCNGKSFKYAVQRHRLARDLRAGARSCPW